MSTSTIAARRPPSRPLNWRTLLLGAGIVVAIVAAVVVLALTSSTTTPSTSPRLSQGISPRAVSAYESDAAHFDKYPTRSVQLSHYPTRSVQSSEPSPLGWGIGHR